MGGMRLPCWLVALIAVTIATAPCQAQSTLAGPVEPVHEPVAMSYGALDAVDAALDLSVAYFKNGKQVRQITDKLEGLLDARVVGDNLEISMKGYSHVSVTDESHAKSVEQMSCLIRQTGQQLECRAEGKVRYPLLDRPGYRTGDTMTLPFGTINDATWDVSGTVKGRSKVGQRPVLVVAFADRREDPLGNSVVISVVTGYAYLDLALGHPVQMELVVDMRGQFRDHDRMLITLRLDTALPGTRP